MLLGNVTGPRCTSISAVEYPPQPIQRRKHKSTIKNHFKNTVHNVQAFFLVLISLSRRFNALWGSNLIDRAVVGIVCYRILLVCSVVIFDGGQIGIRYRLGSFLGMACELSVCTKYSPKIMADESVPGHLILNGSFPEARFKDRIVPDSWKAVESPNCRRGLVNLRRCPAWMSESSPECQNGEASANTAEREPQGIAQ